LDVATEIQRKYMYHSYTRYIRNGAIHPTSSSNEGHETYQNTVKLIPVGTLDRDCKSKSKHNYTQETGSISDARSFHASSTIPRDVTLAVGIPLGVIIITLAVILFAWVWCRKKRRRQQIDVSENDHTSFE
jgi:hypothetical protein